MVKLYPVHVEDWSRDYIVICIAVAGKNKTLESCVYCLKINISSLPSDHFIPLYLKTYLKYLKYSGSSKPVFEDNF